MLFSVKYASTVYIIIEGMYWGYVIPPFNSPWSWLHFITSNEREIMKDDLGKIRKEAGVAYFKILSQNFPGGD
jgi:hypothetical protein